MEQVVGFGYTDAMDVERKEREWVIEGFLPKGFGFITGLPKAGNSPHGGKSVLTRIISWSLISGRPFLGCEIKQPGDVLMVNLDESKYEVAESFRNMIGDSVNRGLKLTAAHAMRFPEDFSKLEADIKKLTPKVLIIDPLLRCVGGRDIKESANTGPILDGLKKIQRESGITIVVVHHCVKAQDRDKESTPSWLNGSVDLDSAWDFCLCLEWSKRNNVMHLRCFYRGAKRHEIYYQARMNEESQIGGIFLTDEKGSEVKIEKLIDLLPLEGRTVAELSPLLGVSESTIKRMLSKAEGKIVTKIGKRGKAPVWGRKPQDSDQDTNDRIMTASAPSLAA